MAPLPPNSTTVLFIDYTTGRNEHTFQVRPAAGQTNDDIDGAVRAFLDALAFLLPNEWRVTGVRRRAAQSNITLPWSLTTTEAFIGSNTQSDLAEVEEPKEFVWVGRGQTSGRRVELSLYGILKPTPVAYRHFRGEVNQQYVDDTLAVLQPEFGDSPFVTIAGDSPLWYPYVNINYNSYWEREQRG